MSAPRRVVVVDDDPMVRTLLQRGLGSPEFEVHVFADPRDALMKLHDIRPDLIVADVLMPEMDGRTFFKVVKRSQELRDVPFLFLSGIHANDEIVAALDEGADDFVNKPFSLERLVAKVRATLRMARRIADRGHDWLSGDVGPAGTLPLMKFCEDRRLTGRLTVDAGGSRRWAEFRGGELVGAGGAGDESPEDALDALLAVQVGCYRIQQAPLSGEELQRAEQASRRAPIEAAPPAAEAPLPLPSGCLATVHVRGEGLQVQTEGENRPNFAVTTVIVRSGKVVRKIETSWQHPLARRDDVELARSQIERQHQRVVATLRELERGGGTQAGAAPEGAVDASLLAWALSFVAEQARDQLGSVMTLTLLRRTHARLVRTREVLKGFRVAEDGRVALVGDSRQPSAVVPAVAEWSAAFLADAGELVEKVGRIRVPQATRMMEADLLRIGFYAALDAAQTQR